MKKFLKFTNNFLLEYRNQTPYIFYCLRIFVILNGPIAQLVRVADSFTIDEILYEIIGLEGKDKLNAIFHLWKFVVPIPRDEVSGDSSPDTRTAWIDKIMAVDPDELHQKIMDEISGR